MSVLVDTSVWIRFLGNRPPYAAQLDDLLPVIAGLAADVADRLRRGGRVYFFGNGGSAADAQHWAAELSGWFYVDRPALPAFALGMNASEVTAIGNDYGYADVFARPLRGFIRPDDVAIGISTSGNSENVVRALEVAREAGLKFPVYLTRAVWESYVTVPDGVRCQDEKGRLWDIDTGHVLMITEPEAVATLLLKVAAA